MAPSQLKKLKASLHENGITGQQRSKKRQRQVASNGVPKASRSQQTSALQLIREQFNPFEVKQVKNNKHHVTSAFPTNSPNVARPGISKGFGEEKRRNTLLDEMRKRRKVGGIVDRRFGESNPTLTPEEKALERFVREKQRISKRNAKFDLEDFEEEDGLTHLGQSLAVSSAPRDDFPEDGLSDTLSGDDDWSQSERSAKRLKTSRSGPASSTDGDELEAGQKDRPKTKNEVMKEVIEKSKLHKYERQQEKEIDDDLREQLDKDLPNLYALMHPKSDGRSGSEKTLQTYVQDIPDGINSDRSVFLESKNRRETEKQYDERLRQMALDLRARPTSRTLTEEEKAREQADRLQILESNRLKRMRGEPEDSDSQDSDTNAITAHDEEQGTAQENDDDDAFGLGKGLAATESKATMDVEDEDDFLLEEDIIAYGSDSDIEPASDSDFSSLEAKGLERATESEEYNSSSGRDDQEMLSADNEELNKGYGPLVTDSLAYTYACPSSHDQLVQMTKDIPIESLPTVVQRIRALYAPQLASDNKAKLGKFAQVLVQHVSHLADSVDPAPSSVLELLIRHIHSLAKTFPQDVAHAYRAHLKEIQKERPTTLSRGDLMSLLAIGSIFPTSDHFHQVVTPAMLCMTRYLEQKIPASRSDLMNGLFVCSLCLQYQKLSRRYVPEMTNYLVNGLQALLPVEDSKFPQAIPHHKLPSDLEIKYRQDALMDKEHVIGLPNFWHINAFNSSEQEEIVKQRMLLLTLTLIAKAAELWKDTAAFREVFLPVCQMLQMISGPNYAARLNVNTRGRAQESHKEIQVLLHSSVIARRPLRLHNHRPLAIKTFLPKFEESYNPDRHYDHDRDRAELSKLKAEHKKERKGALRELRKDANFLARETLKEKREKDAAYEKKYKRLVAEIQGTEGHEAHLYEKEKRLRKGRK